jgi:outer membrane protein TolC
VTALASIGALGCNVRDPAPFDPRGMQRDSRTTAAEFSDQYRFSKRPLPTTLQSPLLEENGRPSGKPDINVATGMPLGANPTVRMSLQEIIQRTVANNGEIRVAGYTPAIDEARVTEAEARFDPTFFANSGIERRTEAEAIATAGQGATVYSIEGGIRQQLQSGGQIELRYRNTLTDFSEPAGGGSDDFASNPDDDPVFGTELIAQFQQPLLRDFGNEVNRARIDINRRNQQISVLEFRRQLEETVSETERFYWQLVQAEREVMIQERLLQRTIDTAFILGVRNVQDVTSVQLSQANASVEQRRSELIRARARVRDLSAEIKRRMQDPTIPVSSPVVILAAVPPVETPVSFDRQEVIDSAFSYRLELGQQQLRVLNAETAAKVANNNLQPQLNLNLQGGLQGIDHEFINSLGDATSLESTNYSLSAALQFEIPIGNRAARAIYARAMLQRMQAIEQYRSLLAQVELEVDQSFREVETTWNEIAATRQARFASADALASIEKREEGLDRLSPEFVQLKLDRQEFLANAERAEAQAISNYNIAISRLELAKGTLLRYNNIVLQEEQMPFVRTIGFNGR